MAGRSPRCTATGARRPPTFSNSGSLARVDREQPGALRAALAGGADAVIDAVANDPAHADQLLEVQDQVGRWS